MDVLTNDPVVQDRAGIGFGCRCLSRDFRQGDSLGVIFNKEAIKLMGLTNPIGAPVTWAGRNMEIVGVVDNMVMGSPYESA
nr:hypothetical protein [Betaproteobacteria bacterium]